MPTLGGSDHSGAGIKARLGDESAPHHEQETVVRMTSRTSNCTAALSAIRVNEAIRDQARMVPPEGESMNSLIEELERFEDQLKPYRYELEELGL